MGQSYSVRFPYRGVETLESSQVWRYASVLDYKSQYSKKENGNSVGDDDSSAGHDASLCQILANYDGSDRLKLTNV